MVHGLAHVCAGAAWLCSVQNAGEVSKVESSKNSQPRHLHACKRQSIGGGRRIQRREKLAQIVQGYTRQARDMAGVTAYASWTKSVH